MRYDGHYKCTVWFGCIKTKITQTCAIVFVHAPIMFYFQIVVKFKKAGFILSRVTMSGISIGLFAIMGDVLKEHVALDRSSWSLKSVCNINYLPQKLDSHKWPTHVDEVKGKPHNFE